MTEPNRFIEHLEELAGREDRAALAALRRGLGQPPGTVAAMYPYVVPWLPAVASRWYEDTCYTIAALFALHPATGGGGNLGQSFRLAAAQEPAAEDQRVSATERRFTALLAAHPDDLPQYLRQAVGYLRSKEIPVNWQQLFRDVLHWRAEDRRVQRAWARGFWGRERQDQSQTAGEAPAEETEHNEEGA